MARRYSRDNRGRFASGGTGATARGGRLKTASGNKRATQTTKAAAAKPSGAIAGKVKRNPAAAGNIGNQPKPAVGRLQSAEARRDRTTQVNDRRKQAKALKALPKPVRRAIRVALMAQRDGQGGAGRSMGKAGLGKKPSSAAISNIQEGRMRLRADFGKRKGKMTEGERQAIYKTMVNSGNVLRGRQRITAAGARVRGMGGATKTMKGKAANPTGLVRRRTAQEQARAAAKPAAPKAASRPDTAASNVPMRGARGRALNAEISRNVNAQKATSRAASKASGRQLKSDQSRAKKLREVHLGPLAAGYAQRSGRKVADVKAAISGMAPSGQIKLFKQYVRENRKKK